MQSDAPWLTREFKSIERSMKRWPKWLKKAFAEWLEDAKNVE